MSDVEFEDGSGGFGRPAINRYQTSDSPTGGLTGWLVKKGIAKTVRQANTILVVVLVLCLIITYFFLHNSPSIKGGKPMPPGTFYGTH